MKYFVIEAAGMFFKESPDDVNEITLTKNFFHAQKFAALGNAEERVNNLNREQGLVCAARTFTLTKS